MSKSKNKKRNIYTSQKQKRAPYLMPISNKNKEHLSLDPHIIVKDNCSSKLQEKYTDHVAEMSTSERHTWYFYKKIKLDEQKKIIFVKLDFPYKNIECPRSFDSSANASTKYNASASKKQKKNNFCISRKFRFWSQSAKWKSLLLFFSFGRFSCCFCKFFLANREKEQKTQKTKRTCTEPCRSAGVRFPKVAPDF